MPEAEEPDLAYTLNPHIDDANLALLHEQKESLGFYVSPDHPLAGKKKVKEQDLDGSPMLLTGHTCSFRNMFPDTMKQHGAKPDIVLETSSK